MENRFLCHPFYNLRSKECYVIPFELSEVFLYALVSVGVAAPLGLLAGVIPGVGGKVALAIFAPLVASHHPAGALMLLLTLHAVVRIGGALPAIVLGIPGSSADVAMTVHGYTLAKKGEALRAVAIASLGGALSGMAGIWLFVVVAVFFSGWLSEMSPTARWCMFAIAFVLIIWGESARRVLAMSVLGVGIFISSVTDNSEQWQLPVLPMMLGLLVVPQLLSQADVDGRSEPGLGAKPLYFFSTTWRDLYNHRFVCAACAALGWVCGLVPGVGGTAVSWMALTLKRVIGSVSTAEHDSDVAGVLAPIAGTMSKEGGSLATTLLLGIPGSTAMIIMVSALGNGLNQSDGTQPLLSTYQFVLIGSVVSFGILIAAILASPLANQLVRIQRLPSASIRHVSLVLVVLSVVIAHFSLAAILVLLLAGLLGVLMDHFSIARIPLIIGLILGADAVALTHQIWL